MENFAPADTVSATLIVVKQLPVIEEQLRSLKEKWEQSAAEADAMVCTEETVQAVKAARARVNQDFDILEEQRKDVKRQILDPYNRFEAIYKECVTDARNHAIASYNAKISEVETDQKRRCEDGLRDYFAELCAAHRLDWLTYERAGINVDMASAKAKTPAKLRRQLMDFVVGVSSSVERINSLDDAAEIMVEFKDSLNAADAIMKVRERHRKKEEERIVQEARNAAMEKEAEVVRRVEAIAAPTVVKPPEKDPNEIIPRCTFTAIGATRAQLCKLKEFLNMEGIRYE